MHLGQLYSDRGVSVGRLEFHQIVTVFPVELPGIYKKISDAPCYFDWADPSLMGSVMTWGDDDESNRSQQSG